MGTIQEWIINTTFIKWKSKIAEVRSNMSKIKTKKINQIFERLVNFSKLSIDKIEWGKKLWKLFLWRHSEGIWGKYCNLKFREPDKKNVWSKFFEGRAQPSFSFSSFFQRVGRSAKHSHPWNIPTQRTGPPKGGNFY